MKHLLRIICVLAVAVCFLPTVADASCIDCYYVSVPDPGGSGSFIEPTCLSLNYSSWQLCEPIGRTCFLASICALGGGIPPMLTAPADDFAAQAPYCLQRLTEETTTMVTVTHTS